METPFSAYQGDEPYIFVCYAHDDAALVYPEITRLHEAGFNVWYDEGVSPGSEWSESLAEHIQGCAVFLYFITPRSVEREHCRQEVNFALDQSCTSLSVHLEPTEVPLALQLSLSHRQAILKHDHSLKAYEEKLDHALEATVVDRAEAQRRIIKGTEVTAASATETVTLERSVAVHDLTTIGKDDALDELAAGLTQEITSLLGSYQELHTTTATDASYVLNGSVQGSADTMRVRVQLIRTMDGQPVWTDVYDRSKQAGFSVQSDLARTIARHVRFQLVRDHECETIRRESQSAEAAEYLCAAITDNYKFYQGGEFDSEFQIINAKKALALDPSLLHGYWLLGIHYVLSGGAEKQARETLQNAMAVAPDHPMIVYLQGMVQMHIDLDYRAAEASFRRAISLDPLHTRVRSVHASLGGTYLYRGNAAEAVKHYRRALRIYESDAYVYMDYTKLLNHVGDYVEAIQVANKGLDLVERGIIRGVLLREKTLAHVALGELVEANVTADEAMNSVGREWRVASASMLAAVGRIAEARDLSTELESMPYPNYTVAVYTYVALGNHDKAFEWLHKAIDDRWADLLLSLIRTDSRYSEMRQDPRWVELMQHLEREEAAGQARNRNQSPA